MKEYDDYLNWDGHGYQLCGVSGVQYTKMQGVRDNTLIKKCNWKTKGDVLEMTLDLDHHTLSFKVNGDDWVKFEQIKQTSYRLARSSGSDVGASFLMME